jgi:hypothetical protein
VHEAAGGGELVEHGIDPRETRELDDSHGERQA